MRYSNSNKGRKEPNEKKIKYFDFVPPQFFILFFLLTSTKTVINLLCSRGVRKEHLCCLRKLPKKKVRDKVNITRDPMVAWTVLPGRNTAKMPPKVGKKKLIMGFAVFLAVSLFMIFHSTIDFFL